MTEQTQDMHQDDFSFSPETQLKLDRAMYEALRNLNRQRIAAMKTVAGVAEAGCEGDVPPVIGSVRDDAIRLFRYRDSLAFDAQEACFGIKAKPASLSQEDKDKMFKAIFNAAVNGGVQREVGGDLVQPYINKGIHPSEIDPCFKGTGMDLFKHLSALLRAIPTTPSPLNIAPLPASVYYVFSEKEADQFGYTKAVVKDENGGVREIKYTAVCSTENWRATHNWPDAQEVFSAEAGQKVEIEPVSISPRKKDHLNASRPSVLTAFKV